MNNKTISIVSYLTFIGWLVSFFTGKENSDSLLKYHLRQSFGLLIFSIILYIILNSLMSITSMYFLGYISIINLVLMIIGIINAANEVEKPLPIILVKCLKINIYLYDNPQNTIPVWMNSNI